MSRTEIESQISRPELEKTEGLTTLTKPIVSTGSFDKEKYTDLTPVIGRVYDNVQLKELLSAPDDVIRDFALLVSTRGVVFLRDQKINAVELQAFMHRFHNLAGAPASHGLHIHPNSVNTSAAGENIQKISSEAQKAAGGEFYRGDKRKYLASRGWHTDISFVQAPADYSALKIVEVGGGDTLWASTEDVYDRLSPAFAKFLEGLEAFHEGTPFLEEVKRNGTKNHDGPRGAPLNVGQHLSAVHPVIRTNPVTGKRAIYANPEFTKYIVGLTPFESKNVMEHLKDLIVHNHDLQVRYRWHVNDLALWDNRSTLHCATFDFDGGRTGERACACGEKPFFDPAYGV